jgi:hypothetical protein
MPSIMEITCLRSHEPRPFHLVNAYVGVAAGGTPARRTPANDTCTFTARCRWGAARVHAAGKLPQSGRRAGLTRPVHPAQAGNSAELGGVRRYDCQSVTKCLTSDHEVVGADRRSALLQDRAYLAGGLGVLVIEG